VVWGIHLYGTTRRFSRRSFDEDGANEGAARSLHLERRGRVIRDSVGESRLKLPQARHEQLEVLDKVFAVALRLNARRDGCVRVSRDRERADRMMVNAKIGAS